VLGLLAVVALMVGATLMPGVALAEEDDGAADTSSTDTSSTDTSSTDTSGTEGTEGAMDSVGLANDEDPGIGAGVSTPGPGPSDIEGPATSPGYVSPTQHEVAPPGPAALPSGLPGPPNRTSVPNMDALGGLACCPTSGPGGNTGEHGQHESDE
jgi:hypothetical protein